MTSFPLDSMLNSFRDPPRLHAMMVHFPIVLAVLGTLATLALLVVRGKVGWLRWVTVGIFLAGAVTGFYTASTGEAADDHLSSANVELTDPANAEFNEHGAMGEKVWMFMAGAGILVALTAVRGPALRSMFLVLALAAALATAAWVAVTAHYGGELVYLHGMGVPQSPNNYPPPKTPPPPKPTAPL